jgi:hypothetical protein
MSVDAVDTGQWSTPSSTLDEGLAAKLVQSADDILSSISSTMTMVATLTLFVKHLKPI